jgi:hypothetical protein
MEGLQDYLNPFLPPYGGESDDEARRLADEMSAFIGVPKETTDPD